MRFVSLVPFVLLAAANLGAADAPKVVRVIEGQKTTFPEKTIAEGVKATLAALESCHSTDWFDKMPPTLADVERATKGDHVRFVFCEPVTVRVLNDQIKVEELICAEKMGFLIRSGKMVVRATKYEHEKFGRFMNWYRQTLPVD